MTAESCLCIAVFPGKQAGRIRCRMPPQSRVGSLWEACAPGGQLDSPQGLRDHSWSGFVSALNLGSPFVKAVARGRNGGNSTGSALVGLGQIAEAGDPRVWCPDDSRPALAFSLGTSTTGVVPWHRRRGRRRGRESRTVLILQERKLGLGLDLESCLKS